jgi:hypothetical protein
VCGGRWVSFRQGERESIGFRKKMSGVDSSTICTETSHERRTDTALVRHQPSEKRKREESNRILKVSTVRIDRAQPMGGGTTVQ